MSEVRDIVQKFKKGMAKLSEELPETIPALAGFMGSAGMAIVFGGEPTLASSATLLLDAIDEFDTQG